MSRNRCRGDLANLKKVSPNIFGRSSPRRGSDHGFHVRRTDSQTNARATGLKRCTRRLARRQGQGQRSRKSRGFKEFECVNPRSVCAQTTEPCFACARENRESLTGQKCMDAPIRSTLLHWEQNTNNFLWLYFDGLPSLLVFLGSSSFVSSQVPP